MNQWYYSSNGKAQGPVTSEFLIENLRKGQLTLVDLVFRAGDAGWVTIGEIPELRAAYNALPLQAPPPPMPNPSEQESEAESVEPFEIHSFKKMISMADSRSVQPLSRPQSGWPRDWQLSSSWVILKRRADGSGFDQDGPYSAEQIIDMIGQGKVDYSQYCWKPGYTRWFRIGNLPEFDRRKRDRDNDTVNQIVPIPEIREALPALSREELLAGVERLRQARRVQEAPPSEADGRDLVRNAIDVTPVTRTQVAAPQTHQAPQAPQQVQSQTQAQSPVQPVAQAPQQSATTASTYQPVAWTQASADSYAKNQAPIQAQDLENELEVPEPKPWTPSTAIHPNSAQAVTPQTTISRPPVAAQAAAPMAQQGAVAEGVSAPANAPLPPSASLMPWSEAAKAPAQNPYPFAEAPANAASATGSMKPNVKPSRSFLRLGVAGAIAGLVVVALLQYASQKESSVEATERTPAAKQPKNEAPAAVETNQQAVPEVAPGAPAETSQTAPVAPPVVAQNAGSTLEIVPLKLSTEPSLTFQTDAGVGQMIDVTLSAKTGEILRYGSYFNTFHVVRSSGEIPTLNLSKLELPPGTYTVTAVVGTAKTEKEIFVGVKGAEFSSQLERHIKGLSYRQQIERKSMFYGSQKLADLTRSLIDKSRTLKGQPKAWKKELANWRLAAKAASMPVLQLAASPRNEAAYYPQLVAFQGAAEKLASVANELDMAIDQKREIASAELDSVLASLSEIQGETATLSGRPKP